MPDPRILKGSFYFALLVALIKHAGMGTEKNTGSAGSDPTCPI
jgi:hypothetical protein